MPERVVDQVGEHLRQPVLVPGAVRRALVLEDDDRLGVGGAELLDDVLEERPKVERPSPHRDASAKPGTREVEQLLDHARHPLPRGVDALDGPQVCLRDRAAPKHERGAGEHGRQRVSQVVTEHADEELAEAVVLCALLLGAPA